MCVCVCVSETERESVCPCMCLCHKTYLKIRVGSSNKTFQEQEGGRKRSGLSAAPKRTEYLRPHISATSGCPSQQEKEIGQSPAQTENRSQHPAEPRPRPPSQVEWATVTAWQFCSSTTMWGSLSRQLAQYAPPFHTPHQSGKKWIQGWHRGAPLSPRPHQPPYHKG